MLKGSTVLYSGTTSGTTLTFTIPADKCRTALGTGSSPTTEVPIQYSCVYSSWDDTTAANAYKLKIIPLISQHEIVILILMQLLPIDIQIL